MGLENLIDTSGGKDTIDEEYLTSKEEEEVGKEERKAADGKADLSADEKACSKCAVVAQKTDLGGYRCDNDMCGVLNFRMGWNEFTMSKGFLKSVDMVEVRDELKNEIGYIR